MKLKLALSILVGGIVVFAWVTSGSAQLSEAQDEAARLNAESANITAQGEYNYSAAAAAVQQEAAQAAAFETSSRRVREWYTRKQINDDYLAAKNPKTTPGLLARLAELKRPDRLTVAQYARRSGELNWPAILKDPVFDEERIALEQAFAQRGTFDAGTDSQFFRTVSQLCELMHEKRRSVMDQMSSADSISARRFLHSLEFEARILPSDLGGLAINDQPQR